MIEVGGEVTARPDDRGWRVYSHVSENIIRAQGRHPDYPTGNAIASADCLTGLRPLPVIARVWGVELPEDATVFRLARVKSNPQGRGGGTAVMRATCAIFDRQRIWAVGEVQPYPGQDFDQLVRFYWGFGFRRTIDEVMVREPQDRSK